MHYFLCILGANPPNSSVIESCVKDLERMHKRIQDKINEHIAGKDVSYNSMINYYLGSVHYFVPFLQFDQCSDLF